MSDGQTRQNKFRFVAKKGSGAFADVIQAENTKTGQMVAIKRMKQTYKSIDQIVELREIQSLKVLSSHPNIVKLLEILFDKSTGRLALVFELMSHDMYASIRNRKIQLPVNQIKWYVFQILNGLAGAHALHYFHRDMKPENVLVLKSKSTEHWTGDVVKLSDFGSARLIGSELPYTEYISTRWYRPPEVLLSDGVYGPEMDIFGLGCVLFELIELHPIFPGKDEFDQICRIHNVIGTPAMDVIKRLRKGAKNNPIKQEFGPTVGCGIERLMTNPTADVVDLIEKMLIYDPEKRITARQCLAHPYFGDFDQVLQEVKADQDAAYWQEMDRSWREARGESVPAHTVPVMMGAGSGESSLKMANTHQSAKQKKKVTKQPVKGVQKVNPMDQAFGNSMGKTEKAAIGGVTLPKLPPGKGYYKAGK